MSERNTAPEFHLNYLIELFYQVLISSQQGSKQRCQWPQVETSQVQFFIFNASEFYDRGTLNCTCDLHAGDLSAGRVVMSSTPRVFLVLRLGLSSTLIYVYRCTFVAIDTCRHGNRKLLQFEFLRNESWSPGLECVGDRQEMPNDRNSNSLSQLSYAMNIDTIYWYYNIHIYIVYYYIPYTYIYVFFLAAEIFLVPSYIYVYIYI